LEALREKEEARWLQRAVIIKVEDMSDMVAEHSAQQAKKHKGQEEKKKSKFKF
jgi:hypothetical protein